MGLVIPKLHEIARNRSQALYPSLYPIEYWMPFATQGGVNVVAQNGNQGATAAAWTQTKYGRGVGVFNVSGSFTASSRSVPLNRGAIIVGCVANFASSDATQTRFPFDVDTIRNYIYVQGGSFIELGVDGRTDRWTFGAISWAVGDYLIFVKNFDRAGHYSSWDLPQEVWVNGVTPATADYSASTGAWGSNTAGTNLHFGKHVSDLFHWGPIFMGAILPRPVTVAEMRLITADPFAPLRRREDASFGFIGQTLFRRGMNNRTGSREAA